MPIKKKKTPPGARKRNIKRNWILKTQVPEEIYTDREEWLEYFYESALKTRDRKASSTVLLGARRMGKTEVFKRVMNRLFFEQDHEDPDSVVPVYFSFPDFVRDSTQFALDYVENFFRFYLAFHLEDPKLIRNEWNWDKLRPLGEKCESLLPSGETLELIIDKYEVIRTKKSNIPERDALWLPRRVSDIDDTSIVMFLDEFQNTRLPQYNFNIVGLMQEAVESLTCPHFVTGSAMNILSKEIIGTGSLYGRFWSKKIKTMSPYWGGELARKAAQYYQIDLPKEMLGAITDRCGGNPFYISAVLHQAGEAKKDIPGVRALNKILSVSLTKGGFIWDELNDQVIRWIERINDKKITKWILYLSSLEIFEKPERDSRKRTALDIEQIQKEIKKREGIETSLEEIREVLIKLSRGDLLDFLQLGNHFSRVKDPILLDFLRVWGKIEVEKEQEGDTQLLLEREYQKKKQRSLNEYKGYLGEIHMSQILLSGQDKKLPGKFFHSKVDIAIPRFNFVEHRYRLGIGKGREIDVIGAAGMTIWVCQSKWVERKKIGVTPLKELLAQSDFTEKVFGKSQMFRWFFAYKGLTPIAKTFAENNNIIWYSQKEMDSLLQHLGLRPLYDFSK